MLLVNYYSQDAQVVRYQPRSLSAGLGGGFEVGGILMSDRV
jgi:hypothetical protein